MGDPAGFRLGPSRGKNSRAALVLCSKADAREGLYNHQLEYLELVLCMRKLHKLCNGVQGAPTEKRSRNIALSCLSTEGGPPRDTKKSRTLQAVPSDTSLPYAGMQTLSASQPLPHAAALVSLTAS